MAEGQEKTESATPKRREEARKRGQVPKSQEVISLFGLLTGFLMLRFFGDQLWGGTENMTRKGFESMQVVPRVPSELMFDHLFGVIRNTVAESIVLILPILLAAMAAGIFSNLIQVGFLITGETLTPKLDKLDPLKGLQKMVSSKSFVDLFKNLIKLIIVLYISYIHIKGDLNAYLDLANSDIKTMVIVIGSSIFSMVMKILVALLTIAILDYAYQRFEHEKSIKMTKQEVKDEYKQREGDPQIKARIRERMRALIMQQMMAEVPQADVVITNPTHYAIAILWTDEFPAPKVLAKGMGRQALRIREIAEENGVTILEDPPLAQSLYKSCEPGEWIPSDLFQAVARVLAFVYKTKGKMPKFAGAGAKQ